MFADFNFDILRVRYEFDDERNRSTPAVRPKGRSAKPPSGLLAMKYGDTLGGLARGAVR